MYLFKQNENVLRYNMGLEYITTMLKNNTNLLYN